MKRLIQIISQQSIQIKPYPALFLSLLLCGVLLSVVPSSCGVIASYQNKYLQADLSSNILVDQFGYRPQDPKVAIIVQSDASLDELALYLSDRYQVVSEPGEVSIYEASASLWQNGEVHSQSGDRVAWFDFSKVDQPGSYFIRNVRTGESSAEFKISETVFQDPLVAAARMFFYQRSSYPKQPPYADKRWADMPPYLGPGQDTEAHFVNDKGNSALVRDMQGGWFDAGDTNKYVTFAATAVHQLLDAFTQNREIWTDDFNIPESGNGIPDLIDELKFELDWLKRMQDNDGGVFIKLGNLDYQSFERPSLDVRPRFYGPKCSSATIDTSGMFAHAALVFREFSSFLDYSKELEKRSIEAWNWYQNNTKKDNCDTQEIKSGDSDRSLEEQFESSVVAAIYLSALTDDASYKRYIEENREEIEECIFCHETWYPYHANLADALFFYSHLPFANPNLKANLETSLTNISSHSPTYGLNNNKDPYRAYMPDDQYHWGSNAIKALYGITNCDVSKLTNDPQLKQEFRGRCLDHLHYLHGVNPLGLIFLTNMYDFGIKKSANEIYHDWFGHGIYDNALTSPSGPAPGFLTGGPNRFYTGDADIPTQYPMKAYLDSNNKYHEMRMWEITEPAIYYQSAYLKLLSQSLDHPLEVEKEGMLE